MRALSSLLVLTVAIGLTGCASVSRDFQGHPTEQVWSALIAAAESPSYDAPDPGDRWTVAENEVWVSHDDARIEIFRRLRRYLHLAGSPPRHESRTWRFRVQLVSVDPPEARFIARGWAIPAWVKEEGVRYFEDVNGLLSEVPFATTPEADGTDHLDLDAPVPPPTTPREQDVPFEDVPATQPVDPDDVDAPADAQPPDAPDPAIDVDDLADEPDDAPDAEVDVDDLLDDPGD